MNNQAFQQDRSIRAFISSTFRDMHEEREVLIKHVFPQLRKLCEERGVSFTEVDLRWGITQEQAERGEVLPTCLAEIERCRPFFIGLLGERYGWVPRELSQELVDQQPWLAEHREKSVTELEIIHGVLTNPAMANRACFYFRKRTFLNGVPLDQRDSFREIPTQDEIKKYGPEEAHRRAVDRRRKLAALKRQIRRSGLAVRRYETPKELGEQVLHDLAASINQEFPPAPSPDPLDRDAALHEAFARSRTGVYIGRPEYYQRLDEHAAGHPDGSGLVILGESGLGKSALLANWAKRYRQSHADDLVLLHFIGAAVDSSNWAAMLRRIMGELKRRFAIEQDLPDKPDELRLAFANWLHMASARGRTVLVIDALNQLDDRDGALDLVWLPPVIPDNVRLIVSTLSGRPLDDLTARGWPTLTVESLTPSERLRLLWRHLRQYRKRLPKLPRRRIALSEQSANPLYLRALLEELRVFGIHERLDERIDYYLAAANGYELYGRILERWEEDFERHRPGLVREAMSLLWAARRGLTESELLELLQPRETPGWWQRILPKSWRRKRDTTGLPLPRADWSPLFLAAEHALTSRGGLIGFFHDYLRQAVQDRYLSSETDRRQAHLRLADYFGSRPIHFRQVEELPWQLCEGRNWHGLFRLLGYSPFFATLWEANPFDLRTYWSQVEANSTLQMVDAYRPILADPKQHHPMVVGHIATMFRQTGHPTESLQLWKHLARHFQEKGDKVGLESSLGGQAEILANLGDLDGAMKLQKQAEQICLDLGQKDGLHQSLGSQALILETLGDLDGAMKLQQRAEQICHELGDNIGLQRVLGHQAVLLYLRGELDPAMALNKEQERICRELGHKVGLQTSFGNQALILMDRGNAADAMTSYKQQERLCRELGDKESLQACLGNQGLLLRNQGELDTAMSLHKEEEQICRELRNQEALAGSLGNQALILMDRGDVTGAMGLRKLEEHILRKLGIPYGLAICLANQANLLGFYMHRPKEALPLIEEAYRMANSYRLDALAREFKPLLDRCKDA